MIDFLIQELNVHEIDLVNAGSIAGDINDFFAGLFQGLSKEAKVQADNKNK